MKIVHVSIPYPPSVNKIYYNRTIAPSAISNNLRGRGLTKEGKAYKKMVADLIHYSYPHIKFGKDDVKVSILSSPPNQRGDNHNGLKIVFDAIEMSGLIDNDKQIVALDLMPSDIKQPGGWDIIISPYTPLDQITDYIRFWKIPKKVNHAL